MILLGMFQISVSVIMGQPFDNGCHIRFDYDQAGNRTSRYWYCIDGMQEPGGEGLVKTLQDSTQVLSLDDVNFTLYPNPASDHLIITFSEVVPASSLRVYDPQGKELSTQVAGGSSATVNTADLQSGNYFISFELSGERLVKAFIVEQ